MQGIIAQSEVSHAMRIVLLIICLYAGANPQAGEKWLYSEYAETDALASAYQGVDSPTQPIPPDSSALIVYFPVSTGCIPYFQVLTREKADAFQLRVDDREIQAFRWFDSSEDGVIATTITPDDEGNKQSLEGRAAEAYLIARHLMVGISVEAALVPSGNRLRWSLNGSLEMIDKAYQHCADSIDEEFPTEQRL